MMRSNYFAVKDEQSFLHFCRRHDFKAIKDKDMHGFLDSGYDFMDGEDDDLDSGEEDDIEELLTEAIDTYPPFEFLDDLANQLAYDNVAVVMQVDNDGMRWITGSAWAVNSRHETREVDLDGIYVLAHQLGPFVTGACY